MHTYITTAEGSVSKNICVCVCVCVLCVCFTSSGVSCGWLVQIKV